MKKSLIYHYAQKAVLECNWLSNEQKLAILRELMDVEDVQKFVEEREAKENEAVL